MKRGFYFTPVLLILQQVMICASTLPELELCRDMGNSIETPEVFVDDDYNSGTPGWGVYAFDNIQAGIAAVDVGGIVHVYEGFYPEHVIINKKLALVGQQKEVTIVDGSGANDVLRIVVADSVLVSGFTFQNGGNAFVYAGICVTTEHNTITANILKNNYEGIYIDNADNNVITANIIESNHHAGIYIENSERNVIELDSIYNNDYDGIYFRDYSYRNIVLNNFISSNGRFGIVMRNICRYNEITGNQILTSIQDGISIGDPGFPSCHYNKITENIISGNGATGMDVNGESNYNTIIYNLLENNTTYGLRIRGSSSFNTCYHNTLSGNGNTNAFDSGTNTWDNGYPMGGNFWDDYTGEDLYSGPGQNIPGSDGLGDTPYDIPGGNNQDAYPLMTQPGPPAPPPETVYVDDDFTSSTPGWGIDHFAGIQPAVNVVNNKGSVLVSPGEYLGNVIILKQLTLAGANKDSVLIDGGQVGHSVRIMEDSVTFSGFKVKNSGTNSAHAGIFISADHNKVFDNIFTGNQRGITLYYADNNMVTQNMCVENGQSAIYLQRANYNNISNNILNENTYDGIYLREQCLYNNIIANTMLSNERYGVVFRDNCKNNLIKGNQISYNTSDGISFGDPNYKYCSSNTVDSNLISYNDGNGILIDGDSDQNLFSSNSIWFNTMSGVKFLGYASSNKIWHNDLVGNGQNAGDNSTNTWNEVYPAGGNYWSDYNGTDLFSGPEQNIPGSDSIGDTPYAIPGGNNTDALPLMFPVGPQPPALPIIVYVDDDFNSGTQGWGYDHFDEIQQAVNVVENEGTVMVAAGVYYENVIVDRKLNVYGAGMDSTIVDGNWSGDVVTVTGDSVVFKGFRITHGGSASGNAGVKLNASHCDIAENMILANGSRGMCLEQASGNMIYENVFSLNLIYGLVIQNQSDSNRFYHNDFMGNGQNALDQWTNFWDDGYPSGGNFWDDYNGPDDFSGPEQNIPGSDGIGDVPYDIPDASNKDNYPLMDSWYSYPLPPDTVYVDDDYNNGTPGWGYDHFSTIQDGIDALSVGGLVQVYKGIYSEHLYVQKTLTLSGDMNDTVIVQGSGSGTVVKILADNVKVAGFTIRYSGGDYYGISLHAVEGIEISDNTIWSNGEGIHIVNSGNNTIAGNTISSNYHHGIYLVHANSQNNSITGNFLLSNGGFAFSLDNLVSNNSFTDNELFGNGGGIGMQSYCQYNTFSNNTISSNGSYGVEADHSDHNSYLGNHFANHGTCFWFHACNYNDIIGNTIQGNSGNGIYLPDCMCGGCKYNNIYHNNWINNAQHVYCECPNAWHNGYPSGGNFWDDYSGVDNFSGPNQNIPGPDGIGDTPWSIPGGNNVDSYPFMAAGGWLLQLDLTIFLEGAFNGSGMNTSLNSAGLLPLSQPYSVSPWNYYGTETVASIPNPDVVDWLLVEFRDAMEAGTATGQTAIGRQAAFLLNDGSVVGMDGTADLTFNLEALQDSLFIVIMHRNSLPVMSSGPLVASAGSASYDFSSGPYQAYGGVIACKELAPGIWGMTAADGNADGQVNNLDKVDIWSQQSGVNGYLMGDFNLDGQVNNNDKVDLWSINTGSGCQVPD